MSDVKPRIQKLCAQKQAHLSHLSILCTILIDRGGVEDTRFDARAKDTKKFRGQGQGQPFRGQILSSIGVARVILIGRGPNHKSHAMTSSEIFKKGTFFGQRYRRMEDLKP